MPIPVIILIIICLLIMMGCFIYLDMIIARYRFRLKYLKSLGFVLKERYEQVGWRTYKLRRFYYKPTTNQSIKLEHLFSWHDSEIYKVYKIDVSHV